MCRPAVTQRVARSTPSTVIADPAMSSNGEYLAYSYTSFAPAHRRRRHALYDAEANVTADLYSLDTTDGTAWHGPRTRHFGRMAGSSPLPCALPRCSADRPSRRSWRSTGALRITSRLRAVTPKASAMAAAAFQKCRRTGMCCSRPVAPNLTGNVANSSRTVLLIRDLQNSDLIPAVAPARWHHRLDPVRYTANTYCRAMAPPLRWWPANSICLAGNPDIHGLQVLRNAAPLNRGDHPMTTRHTHPGALSSRVHSPAHGASRWTWTP